MKQAWRLFVSTLLLVAMPQFVVADAPTYAPYGAWRGRIRYVEGPWRTRSSIHWGNGVTPTGGQVLISGFNVAGNVLTSPNFWSGVVTKEAEPADKEADSSLSSEVSLVQAENGVLRADLDKVLAKLELGVLPTPPSITPLDDGVANIKQLLTEHREAHKELDKVNKLLKEHLPGLLRDGKLIVSKSEDLKPKLSAEQVDFIQQRNDFFSSVSKAYKQPLPELQPEASQQPDVSSYLGESKQLLQQCSKFRDLAKKSYESGQRLRDLVESKEITDGVDVAKRVVDATEKWMVLPPESTDLFKDYKPE